MKKRSLVGLTGAGIVLLSLTGTSMAVGTVEAFAPSYPTPVKVSTQGDDAYQFQLTQNVPGGKVPVRWVTCDGLTLLVQTDGMPTDARPQVAAAANEISQATGVTLHVTYVAEVPTNPAANTITMKWDSSQQNPCDDEEALACARFETVPVPSRIDRIYDAEVLVVDKNMSGTELYATLVHELAHTFDLDHVDSPSQLMYPRSNGQTELGNGDKLGLKLAGQDTCPSK